MTEIGYRDTPRNQPDATGWPIFVALSDYQERRFAAVKENKEDSSRPILSPSEKYNVSLINQRHTFQTDFTGAEIRE